MTSILAVFRRAAFRAATGDQHLTHLGFLRRRIERRVIASIARAVLAPFC